MTCTKRGHSIWTTCACPDCSATRYRQTKLARNGRYHRVPADVAHALVLDWNRQGYSPAWIATAVDLRASYIQAVICENRRGHQRAIGPAYAARIAATDITRSDRGTGPALGSRRRLQALAVIGWSVEELGAQSGVKFTTLAAIQRGATDGITALRAATVAALWSDLSGTRGPSTEATRRALAKGWLPPAAWDDIDDPHETPQRACTDPDCTKPAIAKGLCHGHYALRVEGRSHRSRAALDAESVRDLARFGETTTEAARRLGVQRDSLLMWLERHDPDLKARFARNDVAWEMAA